MQLVLINTERQPRQHLDTLCREIFKVRDHDGLFKSCDECGVDIPDDSPEFTLVAQASQEGSGSDIQSTVVFELKTRYSYITCEQCGNIRLPVPQQQPCTDSTGDPQQAADGAPGPAAPTSSAAAGNSRAAGPASGSLPAAAAAAAAGEVRAGEPVCPVHLQAVYRLTIAPHPKCDGQVNNLAKAYILHCPDCEHVSPELPSYEAVYTHACTHCAHARHTTGDILGRAITGGSYNVPEQPVVWPGEPLSLIDSTVQQLLVRAAAAAATFITLNTRAAARVPTQPHMWRAKQPGTQADPSSTSAQSAGSGTQQQQQLPLALRAWGVALLAGNDDILHDANWARPSLQRLDKLSDPERPAAGLLDVICAPPYVGVRDSYHGGGSLSKLAALIIRRRKALEKDRQGHTPLQQRRQQQQHPLAAAAAGQTSGAEASCGAASAVKAAGAGGVPGLSAGEVLGLMLSEDPAFEAMAAEQRLPTFLQLAQVGSLADVEAALVSGAMVRHNHMTNCGICGLSKDSLLRKNLSCAFERCSYCVAAVCIRCCQHMQALAANGGAADEADSEQTQPTAAASAAAAAAGPKAVSSAAGRREAAAAGDADLLSCWPQGLCPWCADHPDTQHLRLSSSSPDDHHSQQQQQERTRQSRPAAAAAAADSEQCFGPHVDDLSAEQVVEYAQLLNMTDAQKQFLQRRLVTLAASGREWWLMKPGSVSDVPEGVLVIKAKRHTGEHKDALFVSPEGVSVRSRPEVIALMNEQQAAAPAGRAGAAVTASPHAAVAAAAAAGAVEMDSHSDGDVGAAAAGTAAAMPAAAAVGSSLQPLLTTAGSGTRPCQHHFTPAAKDCTHHATRQQQQQHVATARVCKRSSGQGTSPTDPTAPQQAAAAAAAANPGAGRAKRRRASASRCYSAQPASASEGAQQQSGRPGSPDHTAVAAQPPARQHTEQEDGRQQQQQQQQQQQHPAPSQPQRSAGSAVNSPLLGTRLPDCSDLSSSMDTRCRFVLALLTLLHELWGTLDTLGPREQQQQQQQQLLLQLQAISVALLDQGGVEEEWGDTLLIYYGFLVDSVADGIVDEAQHDLMSLLAEGSAGLMPAAQQQEQGGGVAAGVAAQLQQQQGALLGGVELQCIGDVHSPSKKLVLNLGIELRRLFDKLGGGATQQQQQQQEAVHALFELREAHSKLKQVCKALLSRQQGAAGGHGDIRLQVLVHYGFLQAWVAQKDVGQVQQALAALLSVAGPGP